MPRTDRNRSRQDAERVEAFLRDLTAVLAARPAYRAGRSDETDLVIESNPVDAMWASGDLRAEYSAALRVSLTERSVYFWESLKERASRVSSALAGAAADIAVSDPPHGAVRGASQASREFGYGTTRVIVEEVAARHGLALKTAMTRGAALW